MTGVQTCALPIYPTTEEKLMTLLSALLLRCGEAMPRPVDRETLFVELRGRIV